VPPEEFHQREAKRRHEEAIIEQHEKRKRKAREEADRRLWLVLGGRP